MEKNPFYCSFSPLTVLFLTYFFQAFEIYLFLPTFQYLAARFEPSPLLDALPIGILPLSLSLFLLGVILLNPYLGAFADSFGKRKALLLIEALRFTSISLCGIGFWTAISGFYFFGRFIYGVSSTVSLVCLSAITDLYDGLQNRLRAFGLIRIIDGILLSFYLYMITTLPHPSFDPIPSPKQIYIIASLISLLVFIFLYTNFKETQAQVHEWNGPWLRCFKGFGQILREPQIKFLLALYFIWSYSFGCLSKAAASRLYFHSGEFSLILFLFLFVCLLSAAAYFLVPLIFPRIGARTIILFCFGAPALLSVLNWIGHPLPLLTLLLCGLSIGLLMTLYPWLLSQIVPSALLSRAFAFKHALWGAGLLISYYFSFNPLSLLLICFFLLIRFHPRPEFCPPPEYAGE